jgi:hypothetical protein
LKVWIFEKNFFMVTMLRVVTTCGRSASKQTFRRRATEREYARAAEVVGDEGRRWGRRTINNDRIDVYIGASARLVNEPDRMHQRLTAGPEFWQTDLCRWRQQAKGQRNKV